MIESQNGFLSILASFTLFIQVACADNPRATSEHSQSPTPETHSTDEANACIGGDVPVGPHLEAPPADCPSTLSEAAREIQAGFIGDASQQVVMQSELLDPNVINVVLCGTGTPVPSPRTQSCTAVFVGGKFFLFDAGDGASRSIEALNLPLTRLEALFLTHFHSDHIAGVGEVISRSWILGRTTPVSIYGGALVERIVDGFNLVYGVDDAYRVAHHGAEFFPIDVARAQAQHIQPPGIHGQTVYEEHGIRITAFEVDHSPVVPALGYRIEYRDTVVAISGDTSASEGLTNLAANADILVSDVMNKGFIEDTECALAALPPATRGTAIFRDIRTYHIDVAELGDTAEQANVATLALTHLVPTPADEDQVQNLFRSPIAERFSGALIVGEDGTRITRALE